MIKIVIVGIYLLALVSALLFLTLLFKLLKNKFFYEQDETLYQELKTKIKNYLVGADVEWSSDISDKKKRLIEKILIDYLQQLKGETRQKIRILAEKCGLVDFKIEQLVNGNQWWKKSEAAYVLGKLGSVRAIPHLTDYLEEENGDLRYQSAFAIVKISGAQYLSLAIEKLLELDVYPRDIILRLIEAVEEDIYDQMQQLLKKDTIEKKVIAIRGLGLKKDFRVLDWIKRYLPDSEQQLVNACLKAAFDLGDVGDNSYFKLLLTTKNHSVGKVRANLALVLEKFRTLASRKILKELMTDSQWQVRYNAATSLLAHGQEGILALSQQLHCNDKFAQDMAWQVLHQEIIFNSLLNRAGIADHQEIMENIKIYMIENNKEGVKCELEGYTN